MTKQNSKKYGYAAYACVGGVLVDIAFMLSLTNLNPNNILLWVGFGAGLIVMVLLMLGALKLGEMWDKAED
jgi:cytochrome c biogenesis protein CcdA